MLRPATADAIAAAAVALGADALLLARVLRSRHQAQGVSAYASTRSSPTAAASAARGCAARATRRGSPSRQPTRRRSGSRRGWG